MVSRNSPRRLRCFALAAVAAITMAASACGDSIPPIPQPYTEQAVVAAFRKAGVAIPVVLRSGKSCTPKSWPVAPSTESTKAATLYACGRLADAHVDEGNLPSAVLLVGGSGSNYLISIYPELLHAASTNFWLRTLFVPRPQLPVSVLRKNNVVVAGLMSRSDIADANRALANLKQP